MTTCLVNGCAAKVYELTNAKADLGKAREEIAGLQTSIIELQAQLMVRSASVELSKARDQIKAIQARDLTQRRNLDRISDENYQLPEMLKKHKVTADVIENTLNENIKPVNRALEADGQW